MNVTKISEHSKQPHTIDIPITQEQLDSGKIPDGLSLEHSTFLLTGITPEEWSSMLAELDKDDDSDADRRYHR